MCDGAQMLTQLFLREADTRVLERDGASFGIRRDADLQWSLILVDISTAYLSSTISL